ncbi:MAG: hypothetical protein EOP04_06880 [Proteobacteria bacterium]|nr:MAG: hypothetical protein EOP04_06880 [Pseudomonadota bacterium]
MKKFSVFTLMLVLMICIYFVYIHNVRGIDTANDNTKFSTDRNLKETSQVSLNKLNNETIKANEANNISNPNNPQNIDQKSSNEKSIPTSSEADSPMKKLAAVLPQKLALEGFSEEIGTCILSSSKENLTAKKPMSFDTMSDKCAEKHGLNENSKLIVRKIFRDSINNSRSDVEVERWYQCASAKKLNGSTCFNEFYQSILTNFYSENRGNSRINGSDLSKSWSATIDNNIDRLIQQCPELPNSLTEIYAHECSTP